MDRIDQEKIKSKSLDFGKAAKERSRKAAVTLKSSTANLFKRDKEEEASEDTETAVNSTETNSQEEESNQDYEALNRKMKNFRPPAAIRRENESNCRGT